MTTYKFTPDKPASASVPVPYIEDARKDWAPYYSSTKTVEAAKMEVIDRLDQLGAGILVFQPGSYEIDGKKRLGFAISFTLNVQPFNGAPGEIRIAGLPIRTPSLAKERQVRVQALLIVADWLKSAVTARVFNPDAHPLVPYLLVPSKDGTALTVSQAVAQIVNRPPTAELESGQ